MTPPLRISTDGGSVRVEWGALTGTQPLTFRLSSQDQEDLRWYLEDYVRYPSQPASAIASRIEQQIVKWGVALFQQTFVGANNEIWNRAKAQLSEMRIEISGDDPAIPWELMREQAEQRPIALSAASFVRVPPGAAPALPEGGELRVLLVICRPAGAADVPFRAVAGRIVSKLGGRCDVLRPATIDRLQEALSAAKSAGKPYNVVHFDGHGMFVDLKASQLGVAPDPHAIRGYLVFEGEDGGDEYVNGSALGRILRENQTSGLVLNACRSARAGAAAPGEGGGASVPIPFASLAQEAMACGLSAVLAMRFNVFVDSAADAMASIYGALSSGRTLGEGVTLARRDLAARHGQDWFVLEVHEPQPWSAPPSLASPAPTGVIPGLPQPPEIGFVGHDIAILRLDRAFQSHSIVLLHGYIGGGKTAAAAEFAKWYSLTGGLEGPVVFSAMPTPSSADLAALWIWDGLENLNEGRRPEFVNRLCAARDAGKKVLLVSRRPESDWLSDDLIERVLLGPIVQPECAEIIDRLCEKSGAPGRGPAFRRLIRFSFGNPLALNALVQSALAAGVQSDSDCARFVESLRMNGSPADGQVARIVNAVRSFPPAEQQKLAALAVFQEQVSPEAFEVVTGGGANLLQRAEASGLLVLIAEGHFAIHPAMWSVGGQGVDLSKFVDAYVSVSSNFVSATGQGNNYALQHYTLEQANVWHAMRVARSFGDWESEVKIASGMFLYLQLGHSGAEYARLTTEYTGLIDGQPGREKYLPTMWERQADVAEMRGDLASAEGLLERAIEHTRPLLPPPETKADDLSSEQYTLVSQIALEIYRRAQIRYTRGNPYCLCDYLEGQAHYLRLGLKSMAANVALDLGTACWRIGNDRNLAEQSYRNAFGWFDARDLLGKAKCYLQMSSMELERFENATDKDEAAAALKSSLDFAQRALPLLPNSATEELGACYSRLGSICRYAGDFEFALEYSQKSVQIYDESGPRTSAAMARLNVANVLMEQYRYSQAAEYLRDAIRQYESMGPDAADSLQDAHARLAWVEVQIP